MVHVACPSAQTRSTSCGYPGTRAKAKSYTSRVGSGPTLKFDRVPVVVPDGSKWTCTQLVLIREFISGQRLSLCRLQILACQINSLWGSNLAIIFGQIRSPIVPLFGNFTLITETTQLCHQQLASYSGNRSVIFCMMYRPSAILSVLTLRSCMDRGVRTVDHGALYSNGRSFLCSSLPRIRVLPGQLVPFVCGVMDTMKRCWTSLFLSSSCDLPDP